MPLTLLQLHFLNQRSVCVALQWDTSKPEGCVYSVSSLMRQTWETRQISFKVDTFLFLDIFVNQQSFLLSSLFIYHSKHVWFCFHIWCTNIAWLLLCFLGITCHAWQTATQSLTHRKEKKWVPHPHRISTGRDVCLSSAGRMLFLNPCSSLAYLCLSAQANSRCSMNCRFTLKLQSVLIIHLFHSVYLFPHLFACTHTSNFTMFVGGCGELQLSI